jgi:hypothetical protein
MAFSAESGQTVVVIQTAPKLQVRRTPLIDRFIGMDAHASRCTVATMGMSGRRLHSQVVENNAGLMKRYEGTTFELFNKER